MRGILLLAPLLLAVPTTAAAAPLDGVYAGPDGVAAASLAWIGPCQGPGTLVVDLRFVDGRDEERRIPAVRDVVPDFYCTLLLECYQPLAMHYLVEFHDEAGRVDLQGPRAYCMPGVGVLGGTVDGAALALPSAWL